MQGNFQPQNFSHQDSYPNQQNNYQQQQQQQSQQYQSQQQQQQQYGNSQAMQTQQSTGQTRLIPQGIPVYNQQPTYNQAPVYGQPLYDLQDPMRRDSIENQEIIVDMVGEPLKAQKSLQLKDYSEIPTSRFSQKLYCQNCKQISNSLIKFEPGPGTWCVAIGLFACVIWPCCFIPFFNSECKDVHHFCSKCSAQMGVKKFLFN